MILLKELKLNNFLSHENTTIVLSESEKVLIEGRSGSGKSAITDAILFALYGKGRTDNRGLVRRGTRGATVFLKLAEGSKQVAITRTISSTEKNTLVITENRGKEGQFLPIETTGLKDTQEWIEKKFIKASFELFTNSIAYPQENEKSFVKATASSRKDLLLEIIGAGNFDDLYDKANSVIKRNELDYATGMVKISSLKSTIESTKEKASKKEGYEEELKNSNNKLAEYKTVEQELINQKMNITHLSKEINDKTATKGYIENSIIQIIEQIQKNEKEIAENNAIDITKILSDVEELENLKLELEKNKEEMNKIFAIQQKINNHLANRPELRDYSADIETINKRLIPLLNSSTSCPSGDQCPFVVPIKGQIDFLTEQLEDKAKQTEIERKRMDIWEQEYVAMTPYKKYEEIKSEQITLESKIKRLETSRTILDKYNEFGKTLEEREKKALENKKIEESNRKRLEEIIIEIETLKNSVEKMGAITTEVALLSVQKNINSTTEICNQLIRDIALAVNARETMERALGELAVIETSLQKTTADRESLTLLKEALGPKGVKSVVIDWMVPQLEERVNSVLSQLSEFRIRLDTQQKKADDDGVKEGLFITVLNDLNEELPFDSYSGGEKVKITIAISEALASLLNQVGFRIMDENIISLDKESTESFVNVLIKLQEKFSQLLIISHLQEVKEIFSKQLAICKTNGISKITLDK